MTSVRQFVYSVCLIYMISFTLLLEEISSIESSCAIKMHLHTALSSLFGIIKFWPQSKKENKIRKSRSIIIVCISID